MTQPRLYLLPDEVSRLVEAMQEIDRYQEELEEAVSAYNNQVDDIISDLESAHSDVDDACSDFNEVLSDIVKRLHDEVHGAIKAMNAAEGGDYYKYLREHPLVKRFIDAVEMSQADVEDLPDLTYSIDDLDVDVSAPPMDIEGVLAVKALERQISQLEEQKGKLGVKRAAELRNFGSRRRDD